MFRNVTLNPFTIVVNVANTSPSGFPIVREFSRAAKGGQISLLRGLAPFLFQSFDNLFSVKPSVFNKNLARMPAADNHTCQMQAGNIALERIWIQRWLLRMRIELHTKAFDELIIGMISGQRKHPSRRKPLFSAAVLHDHFIAGNLLDLRVE